MVDLERWNLRIDQVNERRMRQPTGEEVLLSSQRLTQVERPWLFRFGWEVAVRGTDLESG